MLHIRDDMFPLVLEALVICLRTIEQHAYVLQARCSADFSSEQPVRDRLEQPLLEVNVHQFNRLQFRQRLTPKAAEEEYHRARPFAPQISDVRKRLEEIAPGWVGRNPTAALDAECDQRRPGKDGHERIYAGDEPPAGPVRGEQLVGELERNARAAGFEPPRVRFWLGGVSCELGSTVAIGRHQASFGGAKNGELAPVSGEQRVEQRNDVDSIGAWASPCAEANSYSPREEVEGEEKGGRGGQVSLVWTAAAWQDEKRWATCRGSLKGCGRGGALRAGSTRQADPEEHRT